ncbi:MAG: hypothetical protein KAS23_09025 [Anaerohalosphaera sp.]|nr:hypothetical protein [Anaerohalosphaera sp.]
MKTLLKSYLNNWKLTFCGLLFCALLALPVSADYSIKWYTVDGGGMQSSGGQFVVTGTIGQPDADDSAGDTKNIDGGFWTDLPPCVVNLELFSQFAEYWLEVGSGIPADLYVDSHVNILDLQVFADNWLCYCPFNWELR